jgi:hypothetical protein
VVRSAFYSDPKLFQTRAGGMAQVVEGLPSKYEALSSNFSIRKKKKSPKKQFQANEKRRRKSQGVIQRQGSIIREK